MAIFSAQVLLVDGILIFNNQEITVDWPDSDTDVDTIPGGAAGISPGPEKCTITANSAIPNTGEDFDFIKAKKNKTELACTVKQLGSSKKVKGTFLCREASIASGVGQHTAYNVRLQSIGTPVPILE